MRIFIASDLHLEFWGRDSPLNQYVREIQQVDAVILPGDIEIGALAVPWAARTFPGIPVFYVMGNHESYGEHIEDTIEAIQIACRAYSNVHFLNTQEFILDNVRILGTTLWTDFLLFGDEKAEDAEHEVVNAIVDYRKIKVRRNGGQKLSISDTKNFHEIEKTWLHNKLEERFSGKSIVVTHMAPSMKSVATRYRDDLVSAAFASNLDELVSKADFWIHGHMHDSFDYMIGKCRVICNPCGYPRFNREAENRSFNPMCIIEV